MNCSEFEQRMQDLIDQSVWLSDDAQLCSHAKWCDHCHQQMELWQQIESVLIDTAEPPVELTKTAPHRVATWSILAAVAAVMLFAFFLSLPKQERVVAKTNVHSVEIEQRQAAVDPALWWRSVQDQDWIGQTMPAVHSVRDGVAPLGRSLLQAVAILTTSRGANTS